MDRRQHFAGPGLATADDCDDGEEVSRVRLRYPDVRRSHLCLDDEVPAAAVSTDDAKNARHDDKHAFLPTPEEKRHLVNYSRGL